MMQSVVRMENIVTKFGDRVVHDGVNLHVDQGEIYGLLGPSGCGKTTLMHEMVMLHQPTSGLVEVMGQDVTKISYKAAQQLRMQWGMLFQYGALFSSLTVAENVAVTLREYTTLTQKMIDEIVGFKLNIVGLKPSDGQLYPSEISGGMTKKTGLARALAMDPKILFLDEPTSGLDPISAREFDALILKLRDMLGLTIVQVSHDLASIHGTLDRMAVIDEKHIIVEGTLQEVLQTHNPFIETFFGASK
jgi:phospholipid/cholesterol/gamma-HCH transport system ATP-binding protein